jgi:hypothetical protein
MVDTTNYRVEYSIAVPNENNKHYWRVMWYDEIIVDHEYRVATVGEIAKEMRRDFTEHRAQPVMRYYPIDDTNHICHIAHMVAGGL